MAVKKVCAGIAMLLICLGSLALLPAVAAAQVCFGDVNGDGRINGADAIALEAQLFEADPQAPLAPEIDANGDQTINAPDIVAVLLLNGSSCGPPTSTPTRSNTATPTPTPTVTRPPTITHTPTRTATPTATCVVQQLTVGASVDGVLMAGDCTRLIGGELRNVDAYEIAATVGQALKVEFSGTDAVDPIAPFVEIVDAGGQFGTIDGVPPAEWVVTDAHPYRILVTTRPGTPKLTGAYRLSVAARPCPTPRAINLLVGFSVSNLRLDETSCPDPSTVSTAGGSNPAHVYTMNVTQVPTQIDIVMRQLVEDDEIDPTFSVIGPDGVELINVDDIDDNAIGEFGTDAGVRFSALKVGTYTLITQGGFGRYSLVVTSPRCTTINLTNIPTDRPLVCPGQSGPGCSGTLYGDKRQGTCGAPLPVIGVDDVPEPGAGANFYTFQAQAGDVVSVELTVPEDDAYLFLLGPATDGNPLVAFDNDSGPVSVGADAQLAATLPKAGVYTIVVANTTPLLPPETGEDTGDVLAYTMYVQKCRAAGNIDLSSSNPVSSAFSIGDCQGFGGVPYRTYAVNGTAGDFVTLRMSSTAPIDPYLRLFGPDGSVVANDNDPFDTALSARVNRILPVTGTYFLEVSTAVETGAPNLQGDTRFVLTPSRCATRAVSAGTVSGTLDAADCSFANGRRYEVLTLSNGATANAADVLPAAGSCVLGLLAEGSQVPIDQCTPLPLQFPMTRAGIYGVIVAGAPGASGPFSMGLRTCAADSLRYGERRERSLSDAACAGADGRPAHWYLLSDSAVVVRFNDGMTGSVDADFPTANRFGDLNGTASFGRIFSTDPFSMYPLGDELGALLRISGATIDDRGSYVIAVDPAELRQ